MVTKKEVGKSAAALVRRIILGAAMIGIVISSVYLINTYVVEPYKSTENSGAEITVNEDNTETTKSAESGDTVLAKYSELLKVNSDFVGKLYIDVIKEPEMNVVQCDNNDKYLTVGFNGETTRYGTPFVDFRNNIKDLNTNTTIYGHNMVNGREFGLLPKYKEIEVYREHPTIKFNTIYRDCTWKIFASFVINTKSYHDNGYIFPYRIINFPSEQKFLEFIDDVKSRSYYINDTVDIVPGDKILTISTCCYDFDDERFVLMARLVRDGESEDVNVKAAKKNENQRFPQIWYDNKGQKNPFKDAVNFSIS